MPDSRSPAAPARLSAQFLAQKPVATEGSAGGQDDLLFFVRPEPERGSPAPPPGSLGTSLVSIGLGVLRRGGSGGDAAGEGEGEGMPGRVFVRRWRPALPTVGRCRLTVSKPVLKAPMVSALETVI